MREAFIVDDIIDIPEDIRNMTLEELEAEIARMEAEIRKKQSHKTKPLTEVGGFFAS